MSTSSLRLIITVLITTKQLNNPKSKNLAFSVSYVDITKAFKMDREFKAITFN